MCKRQSGDKSSCAHQAAAWMANYPTSHVAGNRDVNVFFRSAIDDKHKDKYKDKMDGQLSNFDVNVFQCVMHLMYTEYTNASYHGPNPNTNTKTNTKKIQKGAGTYQAADCSRLTMPDNSCLSAHPSNHLNKIISLLWSGESQSVTTCSPK